MNRPQLRAFLACLVVLLGLAGVAWSQGQAAPLQQVPVPNGGTTVVQNGDTFPAALGYAAIALAGTVWGVVSGALLHLWNRLSKEAEAHAKALEVKNKELSDVQDARRLESEKLLREQKDIFAEVMVTTAKLGTAFDETRMALGRLQEATDSLNEYLEQIHEQGE